MRAAIVSILAALTPAVAHAAVLVGLLHATTPESSAADIRWIDDLPGGDFESVLFGVSADGQVAVGHARSERGMEAVAWRNGTFTLLGDLEGGEFFSVARAASADGGIIVGAGNWTTDAEAFRWTGNQMNGLGDLDGGVFRSEATAVSANGSVIVGSASVDSGVIAYPDGSEAFRWENGVLTGIGRLPGTDYSRAFGISADGRVIVGGCASFASGRRAEAFRWEGGTMIGLGYLQPEGERYSHASATTADGSVIAGYANSQDVPAHAFRWESGQMVALTPDPGGNFFTHAMAISADGSVIVGSGEGGAFIWDSRRGTRHLVDVLRDDYGISLDGRELLQATGISADGKTIVGYGRNLNGDFEGWVVQIPEPSALVLAAVGAVCLARRFRRQ